MQLYKIIILTLIAAFIVSVAQLLFKRSVKKTTSLRDVLALATNKGVLVGVIASVVGLALYLVALSGGELALVYPVFSSTFIFVTLISAFTLKEKITSLRALGLLLIFLGIALVAL